MSIWDDSKEAVTDAMKAVFAEPVNVEQSGQELVSLEAIFTERFQMVELSGEIPIQSTAPVFDVVLSDLGFRPKQGATIARENGDAYEVTQIEPDGEGGAKLITVKRR